MSLTVLVDLRDHFNRVRDQGARSTCLACAASDVHAHVHDQTEPLSAEYAYYMAICRSGSMNPNAGVAVGPMFEALEFDGQPMETVWPYSPTMPTLAFWKPPTQLGNLFRGRFRTTPTARGAIRQHLSNRMPLLLGLRISTAFYTPPADHIIGAKAGDPDTGNHAVVAVGLAERNSQTLLLVRNSWGDTWADSGYAWLDESYWLPRLIVVAIGEKV